MYITKTHLNMISIRNRLYLLVLKLFGGAYRPVITDDGFIPFTVTPWTKVNIGVTTKYCDYDYITFTAKALNYLSSKFSPVNDNSQRKTYDQWATLQQMAVGNLLAEEAQQDVSLEDFLLNKTGSFFLKRVHVTKDVDLPSESSQIPEYQWVVDFSYMESYPVKEGYYCYGGKVIFDDDRSKIISIEYKGVKYTEIPDWLQMVVRSTVAIVCVVEVHFCRLHINTAQKNVLKWRNEVSDADPLVPLLQVVSFNTLVVNRGLVGLLGIFQATYALTKNSFDTFITDSLAKGGLDNNSIYGFPGTAWNDKMVEYATAVTTLVSSLYTADMLSSHDNLIDYIVACTAGHNQFGDALGSDLFITGLFPPAVKIVGDVKTMSYIEFINLRYLLVFVSARPPLFADDKWYQHFPSPQQKEHCSTFQQWMASRNTGWFRPAYFEISIGV